MKQGKGKVKERRIEGGRIQGKSREKEREKETETKQKGEKRL